MNNVLPTMKARMFLLAVVFISVLSAHLASAADEKLDWKTDYREALQAARGSNKPILADFTGSDWCGWCIKLSKDVFSQPAFAKYAKEKLVLLEIDFPQQKTLPEKIKSQNEELAQKFGVEGFPTLVLLDHSGKEIARHSGYLAGGPEAMIAWINESIAKR